MPHITQIAASMIGCGKEFSTYVSPKVPIAMTAQQITGIIYNNSGIMTARGQQVQPKPFGPAIDNFCKWLEHVGKDDVPVYLIAHNGRKFDFPVLISALISLGYVMKFLGCVAGFIDSINVFKKSLPGQSSYKQEDLAKTFLSTSYDAHNAVADVKILGQLISYTKLSSQELALHSFSPSAVHNQLLFNKEKKINVTSLHQLVGSGVMKMATAENIAGSGLNLGHLRKIYERDGEDGLRNTFTYKNSEGQARVTNVKKTLEEVIPKLLAFFTNGDAHV